MTSEACEKLNPAEAAEWERIANRPFEAPKDAPSANGVNGSLPPSANVKKRRFHEGNGRYEPSTNGDLPPDARSRLPAWAPSPKGNKRLSHQGDGRREPSTNGEFRRDARPGNPADGRKGT